MDRTGVQSHVNTGADVIGRDNQKLGTVACIVVNPAGMHMTDIVVNTGTIMGRQVILPADRIENTDDGEVRLSVDEEELDGYPDYVEVEYQAPPAEWAPPPEATYSAGSIVWPATAFPEIVDTRVNAPAGSHGIGKGMEVDTSDGHRIGAVESVDIDLATDTVTGFVVKRGLVMTHEIHISASDVDRLQEGTIIVKLTEDQVRRAEQAQNP